MHFRHRSRQIPHICRSGDCGAARIFPYAWQRHGRPSRTCRSPLGRFLPRLGPLHPDERPLLCAPCSARFVARLRARPAAARGCSTEARQAGTRARHGRRFLVAAPAIPWGEFCNAKIFRCILCAAQLERNSGGGMPADFVALLGRFLPRLGPHGTSVRPLFSSRLLHRSAILALIPPPGGAPAARARPRIPSSPSRSGRPPGPGTRRPCAASPRRDRAPG